LAMHPKILAWRHYACPLNYTRIGQWEELQTRRMARAETVWCGLQMKRDSIGRETGVVESCQNRLLTAKQLD